MADRLKEAFSDIRTAAMRTIEAPGVDAVRRTVRRRRMARASVASLAFTGVVLVSALALAQPGPGGHATNTTDASPSDTGSITPSASVTPSQWSEPVTPTPSSSGATNGATVGAPTNQCVSSMLLRLTQANTNNDITVVWDDTGVAQCAGASAGMFWATYTLDSSGNAHLYASQKYVLGPLNKVVHATLDDPGGCGVAWYVVFGDSSPLQTIPAKEVSGSPSGPEPFQNKSGSSDQADWDVRPSCGSTSPSPYHTLPSKQSTP